MEAIIALSVIVVILMAGLILLSIQLEVWKRKVNNQFEFISGMLRNYFGTMKHHIQNNEDDFKLINEIERRHGENVDRLGKLAKHLGLYYDNKTRSYRKRLPTKLTYEIGIDTAEAVKRLREIKSAWEKAVKDRPEITHANILITKKDLKNLHKKGAAK